MMNGRCLRRLLFLLEVTHPLAHSLIHHLTRLLTAFDTPSNTLSHTPSSNTPTYTPSDTPSHTPSDTPSHTPSDTPSNPPSNIPTNTSFDTPSHTSLNPPQHPPQHPPTSPGCRAGHELDVLCTAYLKHRDKDKKKGKKGKKKGGALTFGKKKKKGKKGDKNAERAAAALANLKKPFAGREEQTLPRHHLSIEQAPPSLPLPTPQSPDFFDLLPSPSLPNQFPPLPHPTSFLSSTVVLWEGKPLATSVPDRSAHLPSKIDPLLHLRAFLPVYKSIQQAFFDNPKMSLCVQLWNSSVEKQRKFGSKAEFLGQAKFDSMMLTELLDGRDAWMGVTIPPQGDGLVD